MRFKVFAGNMYVGELRVYKLDPNIQANKGMPTIHFFSNRDNVPKQPFLIWKYNQLNLRRFL